VGAITFAPLGVKIFGWPRQATLLLEFWPHKVNSNRHHVCFNLKKLEKQKMLKQKLNATNCRIDCLIKERLLAGDFPLTFTLIRASQQTE